jgi:hypothetical protein
MNYYYKDDHRPDDHDHWHSKDKNKQRKQWDNWDDHKDRKKSKEKDKHKDWDHDYHNESDDWDGHKDHKKCKEKDRHKDWDHDFHYESDDWDDRKDRKKCKEKDKHKGWDHDFHYESDDWDDRKDRKKCKEKDKHKGWDHDFHYESDDWDDRKDRKKCKDRDKHKDWDHDFHDCGCEKDHHHEKHSHNCVCKKVRDINEAQHKVSKRKNGCDVSCERSIQELLQQGKHPNFDTIPFKLLCGCSKGDCETFVGTGVVKIDGCFYDIKSTFFRVVDFVKGSSCCAILELLCPERCEGKHHGIEGFIRTGACFEVDLKDFVGITCFPPVKAKKMDPHKLLCSGRG